MVHWVEAFILGAALPLHASPESKKPTHLDLRPPQLDREQFVHHWSVPSAPHRHRRRHAWVGTLPRQRFDAFLARSLGLAVWCERTGVSSPSRQSTGLEAVFNSGKEGGGGGGG